MPPLQRMNRKIRDTDRGKIRTTIGKVEELGTLEREKKKEGRTISGKIKNISGNEVENRGISGHYKGK